MWQQELPGRLTLGCHSDPSFSASLTLCCSARRKRAHSCLAPTEKCCGGGYRRVCTPWDDVNLPSNANANANANLQILAGTCDG